MAMRSVWVAILTAVGFGCGADEAGMPDAMPDAAVMVDAGTPPDAAPVLDSAPTPDSGSGVDDERCDVAPGTGVNFVADGAECDKLSSYRFFVGATHAPNQGVVPYDLNTPLFSDYTYKHRFIWLPEGTAMTYDPSETFGFPEGAVIIKTFAYPEDRRQPDSPQRLLETRLLYLTASGWEVITYVWNQEQTEAYREVAGDVIASQWVHDNGTLRTIDYLVPNKNQCKNCHEEREDELGPIGPKARHLNRDYTYPDGVMANQLQHLAAIGYLDGLPDDLSQVPAVPAWDDETVGTLDARARGWLDINCAHCHNPQGAARTSGLDLRTSQDTPSKYGVCKAPVAAGGGSGGHQYSIEPGKPDESILMFRLESVELDVRMPEVGRQLIDDEGNALIRDWIAAMEGSCEPSDPSPPAPPPAAPPPAAPPSADPSPGQ